MKKDKEILFSLTKKDFIVQPFKGSGPGGQNKNKNSTAIRIIHPESGAKAEAQEHKSQLQNKKAAFTRLVETDEFKKWHRIKVSEKIYGKQEIDKKLDEWMREDNIKTETIDPETGKWTEIKKE